MFENRVLRIFGLQMMDAAEAWTRLPNKGLHTCMFHHKLMVIKPRSMRWVAHVACMGEMRNAYKILVRKPEGKRPL
jgi:hypothetical protein